MLTLAGCVTLLLAAGALHVSMLTCVHILLACVQILRRCSTCACVMSFATSACTCQQAQAHKSCLPAQAVVLVESPSIPDMLSAMEPTLLTPHCGTRSCLHQLRLTCLDVIHCGPLVLSPSADRVHVPSPAEPPYPRSARGG